MSRTTRSLTRASALALCSALVALFSNIASAASINYGNFNVPPSSMALNVTESSATDAVPIYGPPTPFPTGLDFDPVNFVASASGGTADITDGQLNFTFMSPGLLSINLSEAGDYTLAGVGTPATQVFAAASLRATITQINGVDVAPIVVGPANNSFGAGLPPAAVLQPWTLGVGLDLTGALGGGRATKVDIVINNQLLALSEPASVAFIAKKEFILDMEVIPEPATFALAGLALCGLVAAARKRD
jgi:hypothetical protein